MKILVINGPNLNMLGTREPEVYGSQTLDDIVENIRKKATGLGVSIDAFQSNDEGALVTAIQNAAGDADGLIINPAAYTHTSVALRDALLSVKLPTVEVHLSNTHTREEFRKESLTAPATIGQVVGFGAHGYLMALEGLVEHLKEAGGS